MLSESKRKANDRYLKSNYEHITLSYPKGTREIWKQAAKDLNISLAELVRVAVTRYIKEVSQNERL